MPLEAASPPAAAAPGTPVGDLDGLPPLPGLPLAQRVYASSAVHRAVPLRVALPLVRQKADLAWRRSASTRDAARQAMDGLIGATHRASEVDALARAHLRYGAERAELEWRPGLGPQYRVENPELVRTMRRERGGFVHLMHHGPFCHLPGALSGAGAPFLPAVADFYFGEPVWGLTGHRDRAHLRSLVTGGPVLPAGGAGRIIPELLEGNEVIGLAFDLPGRFRTQFLGREVWVASGIARLALVTNRPVVCATWERRRGSQLPVLVLRGPLQPSDHAGPAGLLRAIAAEHEPAVLAWPEAMDRPLDRWHTSDPSPGAA